MNPLNPAQLVGVVYLVGAAVTLAVLLYATDLRSLRTWRHMWAPALLAAFWPLVALAALTSLAIHVAPEDERDDFGGY